MKLSIMMENLLERKKNPIILRSWLIKNINNLKLK